MAAEGDNKRERRKRAPSCVVCRHPERVRIEMLRAGGASFRPLAEKFGVGLHSVHRHWRDHVSDELKASYLAGPVAMQKLIERAEAEGGSVLDHLKVLRVGLTEQFIKATEAGDRFGAATVSGRLLSVLVEIGRITGELIKTSGITVNNNTMIVNGAQMADLQVKLMRALAPFPEARAAVVAALRDLEPEEATKVPVGLLNGRGPVIEGEAVHG